MSYVTMFKFRVDNGMPVNVGQGNIRCYFETHVRLVLTLCDEKKIFLMLYQVLYIINSFI
jgi:hypothetical protein